MFGMPSRTRFLFHGLGGELRTIDRDLDLAITEFAPGAQKTKDKRVYTAIGFSPVLVKRGTRIVNSNPDNPLPGRRWMLRCERCQHTLTSSDEIHAPACPECGALPGPNGLTIFRTAVPSAFRTDFGRGRDAREEGDFLFSAISTIAESQSSANATSRNVRNSSISFINGRVFRLNSNRGNLFTGCIGNTSRPRPALNNQWIGHAYQDDVNLRDPVTGRSFADQDQEQLAIVAPKTTDLLRIRPVSIPDGMCLNPLLFGERGECAASASCAKAGFYSAAFVLRAIASLRLDIDPDEININCLRAVEDRAGHIGEIVMSDNLPNGAGFVAWMNDNYDQLIHEGTETNGDNRFIGDITSEKHRRDCDSSCPQCLRNFRNMQFHGLLDWRLGISTLKALNDSRYACGLDGNFNGPELIDWAEHAVALRDSLCESFGTNSTWRAEQFGSLPGFVAGHRKGIMIHPLWSRRRFIGVLAEAVAETEVADEDLILADTFNVGHRMSWTYMQWTR